MMARFIGITREPVFSPGRVDDDAAILLAVAERLREAGHTLDVCCADDAQWPQPDPGVVVFTMAQGDVALSRLRQWEQRGIRVINSVAGILNCQRHRTVPLLTAAGLEFPESVLVASATAVVPDWVDAAGAWVKRGDVHATDADDVVFAANIVEARAALARFAQRGIVRAVVQRHAPGLVVKFYAVRGRFFHAVPPADGTQLPPSTLRAIDRLGQRAAAVLDVEVYGGDCVVGMNGELRLIDLNDWPSYARCRFAAACEIAAHVGNQKATGT